MNLIEIENLSAVELKARRDELVEAAKGAPVEELAARYVQARLDATQRDEKLAEQGKTITALQDALSAAKAQAVAAQLEGRDWKAQFEASERAFQQVCLARNQIVDELQQEQARSARLAAVANRNHQAVSQAAKLLNDVLAANAVDQAAQGEA